MAQPANQTQFDIEVASIDIPLKVLAFEGVEKIGHPFHFHVTIVCDEPELELENWLQLPVTLTLKTNNPNNDKEDTNRYINGMVYSMEQLTHTDRHCQYQLVITPRIELLKHRCGHRIFQDKTVSEIITLIFNDAGILSSEYQLKCSNLQQPKDYCVQYAESELDFIQRLMSEQGLHYHFEHQREGHKMIIADGQDGFLQLPALPYNQSAGLQPDGDTISAFQLKQQTKTGKISLRDYHFQKPEFTPQGQAVTNITNQQPLEHYQYPGGFNTDNQGVQLATLALEQHRSQCVVVQAQSNCSQITSGYYQPLTGYNKKEDWNCDWLVTEVQHCGKQPQVLEELADGAATYQAHFYCTPWDTPFRTTTVPKPFIENIDTAMVTGPEGEEIYCDEFGRVKVQFHWDREGLANEKTSCWLRTSQAWAGNGYGQLTLPRIGHEVIVSFINGDPDHPIITGSLYNGQNKVPYELPANKTRSTFKTSSSMGGDNFNELRFEDKKESEQIYLHAAKDMDVLVNNDRTQQVFNDDHLTVHDSRYQEIKADNHNTVQNSQFEKVKGDAHQQVEGAQHIKVGGKLLTDIGNELHLSSGQKIVLEAGAEVTLKAGGSFVKVDPSGVTLSGPGVKMNSGGSPGSGSSYLGKIPIVPRTLLSDTFSTHSGSLASTSSLEQLVAAKGATSSATKEINYNKLSDRFEKLNHKLTSTFAFDQLTGLAKKFDQQGFSMWLSSVYGHDIPAKAYKELFNTLNSGSLLNPEIEVVSGKTAFYDNSTQKIHIGDGYIKESLETDGQEAKAKLLMILTHEFGHHIDHLLRNTFSHIGGDAKLDEGAAFAASLPDLGLEKSPKTLVAQYEGSWGSSAIDVEYSNIHTELKKQAELLALDKKSHHGDREYFSAGGTLEQARKGKYGHRSIESILGTIFQDSDLDKIYYGNWLRDYSQIVDLKVLEFNGDLLVNRAKELNSHSNKQTLQTAVNKQANTIDTLNNQIKQLRVNSQANAQSIKRAVTELQQHNSTELAEYLNFFQMKERALVTQQSDIAAQQSHINTLLSSSELSNAQIESLESNQQTLKESSNYLQSQTQLIKQFQGNINSANRYQTNGANNINSAIQTGADGMPSQTQLNQIATAIESQKQYLPTINNQLDTLQTEISKGIDSAEALANTQVTDSSGITSGGATAGSRFISRSTLTTVVEILARQEFSTLFAEADNSPYRLTAEKLGVYRPEEHLDNPYGIVSPSNPHSDFSDFRSDYEATEGEINPETGYKNYFSASITYAKQQLTIAYNAGRTAEGFIHFGQALHVLEDIYAHSNFIELAINRLWREGKINHSVMSEEINTWVALTKVNNQEIRPLVTGTFGSTDTIASLLSVLEKKWDHTKETEKDLYYTQVSILLALMSDYQPNFVNQIYHILGLEHSTKQANLDAEHALELAKKLDDASYLIRKTLDGILGLLFSFANDLKAILARQLLESIKHNQHKVLPTDPSHTQLAKDPDDHPLHTIAAETARVMVGVMGETMDFAWRGLKNEKELMSLVDDYFVHPNYINQSSHSSLHDMLKGITAYANSNSSNIRKATEYKGHFEHEKEKLEAMSKTNDSVIIKWLSDYFGWKM
ncbi:MAG: type VI secretion system tip protein VgrG [Aliivibrio sp.]|uniref:type VI secretion system tip protein TssI/VgrG n=1 Tax=Aliivibrio sp. TaxID=1872443 RepID=UPI001A3A8672|nr:type VI secretion system tip protein VgrG [Aliivibrio sp.]